MLNRDEAEKRLKTLTDHDWAEPRLKSLTGIPGAGTWLRARSSKSGGSDAVAERAKQFRVASLSDADRARLFQTLFPKIAPHLERAWQDIALSTFFINAWK
ncbi:MAG: hypothetical protein K2X32_09520, partial [Phycisphaerales bacterium]|nr:hypothetical protein [Phycisphaerales bacterium]